MHTVEWIISKVQQAGFSIKIPCTHSVHSSAPLINPLIEYFKVRLRTAQVDFCPFLPSSEKVHFVVTSSGIRGVRVSEWQVVTVKNLSVPNIARIHFNREPTNYSRKVRPKNKIHLPSSQFSQWKGYQVKLQRQVMEVLYIYLWSPRSDSSWV